MLNFTIYTADCVGNSGNCLYPNKIIVTDKESFIKATKMDHVTAKYEQLGKEVAEIGEKQRNQNRADRIR